MRRVVLVCLTVLATGARSASPAPAVVEVRLGAVFGHHAVLQRDQPLKVWGFARAGEDVTVTLAGKTAKATTATDGRFEVALEALPAGGPYELVAAGSTRAVATDVLVGEVWPCSGQSNMAMQVAGVRDADAEAQFAAFPSLRVFTAAVVGAGDPETDVRGAWVVTSPETVKGLSAVAYFFGRTLHKTLAVPVGLVVSSVGGTVAEAWTPPAAVEHEPALKGLWDRWEPARKGFDRAAAEAKREKALKKWRAEVESDRRAGRTPPPEPAPVGDPRANVSYPGSLWNGMVAPLVPLAVRGVIWYQGESNAPRAEQYRVLFPTLIRAWRAAWGREDLPFHFVQLANFGKVEPSGVASPWAELREAQSETLKTVPHTGMAVTIDIGEPADIHPKNKQEVGRRLALWALAKDYGKSDVVCAGPTLKEQRVEDGKLVLTFENAGAGLSTSDGRDPVGFAIASAKGAFVPAKAKIEGDHVVVWTSHVPHPTAVRYAWADAPDGASLTGPTGLPASPFRTDDRPMVTAGRD
jgi:sialate O-acetylesterase